jgi:L-2-hydroxyglutarate oxidase
VKTWDVAVVGGGILGTSVAYWLASLYECAIAVVEREPEVALHTSRRNTGVIHRPFYLDPKGRRIFARSAQVSYGLWKRYAAERGLPWETVGTLEVALRGEDLPVLEKYLRWGLANGMAEEELELMDPQQVAQREPHVRCLGAILCRTDTAVDYHALTVSLRRDAEVLGASFLLGRQVEGIEVGPQGTTVRVRGGEALSARFLINCGGGNSLRIAHGMGLGMEYADLYFRGEYWLVDPRQAHLAGVNVYSVPARPDLPFLDPHWVVRANGRREIGPNAVPVPGPTTYEGLVRPIAWAEKFLEPPARNKAGLLFNGDFLSLAAEEWLSSLSKDAMAERARRFLPGLRTVYLVERGTAGVRASVIDSRGNFIKEAIEILGPNSYHITNYNSPGATGAPAYAAHVVDRLRAQGHLDHLKSRPAPRGMFDPHVILDALEAQPTAPEEAVGKGIG